MNFVIVDNILENQILIAVSTIIITIILPITLKRRRCNHHDEGNNIGSTTVAAAQEQGDQSIMSSILSTASSVTASEKSTRERISFKGPVIPQTIIYNVTTPPLSRKNVPVLTSPHNIRSKANIYQTLTLDLEHMFLEQKTRVKVENSPQNTSNISGDASVDAISTSFLSTGVASLASPEQNHQNYNYDHDKTRKSKNETNKKRKKKSTIIPISAIANVSTQEENNPATLIVTIDTQILNSFKKRVNDDTNQNSQAVIDGGLSGPYQDLVNNQVTIENWDTHGMNNDRGRDMKIDEPNIEKMVNFSNNQQYTHDEIYDDIIYRDSDYDDDEDDGDDDSSTIKSADVFSQYTLGKIPTDGKINIKSNQTKPSKLIEREYTFSSKKEAASFQTLYLVLRVVGKEIRNMYSALESIHIDIVNDRISINESEHDDNENDNRHDTNSVGDGDNNDKSPSNTASPLRDGSDNNEEQNKLNDQNDKLVSTFLSYDCFGIQRLQNVGVHWNDVLRCLGELPFIKPNYDIKYKCENNVSFIGKDATKINHDDSILFKLQSKKNDMYKDKRVKLGYLDFLNLFVPHPFKGTPYYTPTILAGDEHTNGLKAHQSRIKQLLELRELIAIASTRVHAYINAMEVVQEGWQIPQNENEITSLHNPACALNDDLMLSKRLTFDEDSLNAKHDTNARNQYYEPLAGLDARRINDNSGSPLHQAFSLVDCHILEYNKELDENQNESTKFFPHNDPVVVLPSLKNIMEKSPDKEFFVVVFFYEITSVAIVTLFTRNIARGIDTTFDDKLDSYVNSQGDFRNIELSIQLGPKPRMSYARLAAMLLKTTASRFLGYNVSKNPYYVWQDTNRISFPPFNLSQHSKVRHFGGLSQSTSTNSFPNNYFAVTCGIESSFFNNYPAKIFNDLKEQGTNIVDFIFHLENCQRPLSIFRMVRVDPSHAEVLPTVDSTTSFEMDEIHNEDIDNDEPDVELLKEILSCITVPVRVGPIDIDGSIVTLGSNKLSSKDNICDTQVLSLISDGDLLRHLNAAKFDLKEAAVRVVKCAAWRGVTFPIDTRVCEIELKSNQCFCQGFDKDGNPILYFRNMCRGLWRKDVEATILATLYRLETACQKLMASNPNFKFTLIILMGQPFNLDEGDGNPMISDEPINSDPNEKPNENKKGFNIDPINSFHVHTNIKLVQQLIGIIRKNYPERLAKALIIPNSGWQKLLGSYGLERYVSSLRTAKKIVILNNMEDLLEYVAKEELSILVGGSLPIIS